MLEKFKNRVVAAFTGKNDNKPVGDGVYATVAELIKEQYNTAGISFFNTKSRNITAGASASPFKGRGMEFDEVRLYQAGDDVRSIDWRVTARKGEPYTKLFKEERERQVLILADMRERMHFGTKVRFKSTMAAKISALIAWGALGASEKVGGMVVANSTMVVPPHKSRKNVLTLLQALSDASQVEEFEAKIPMAQMLLEVRRVAKVGGIAFIISDWHDFDDEAKRQLMQIKDKCDVVAINVFDRLEEKAPPEDRYLITDGKDTLTLYADDSAWRLEYESYFRKKREEFDSFCKRNKIISVMMRAEDDPVIALSAALNLRKRKRK